MIVRLRRRWSSFVPALMLAMAAVQLAGSRPVSAEEMDDGKLETAAYDVIIVPREGRTSRSRIWTDRGWTTLPTQRDARPYGPPPRVSGTPAFPRTGDRRSRAPK